MLASSWHDCTIVHHRRLCVLLATRTQAHKHTSTLSVCIMHDTSLSKPVVVQLSHAMPSTSTYALWDDATWLRFPRCFSSAQTLSTHPHSSTWARTSESEHRPLTRLFLLTVDFMQLIWIIAAILYVSLSHMGLIWGVVCARCVLEGRCDRAQLLVCASAVHSFAFSFLLFPLPI